MPDLLWERGFKVCRKFEKKYLPWIVEKTPHDMKFEIDASTGRFLRWGPYCVWDDIEQVRNLNIMSLSKETVLLVDFVRSEDNFVQSPWEMRIPAQIMNGTIFADIVKPIREMKRHEFLPAYVLEKWKEK